MEMAVWELICTSNDVLTPPSFILSLCEHTLGVAGLIEVCVQKYQALGMIYRCRTGQSNSLGDYPAMVAPYHMTR